MSNIFLKAYQWLLRAAVEIMGVFPPKIIEREEFLMRLGRLPEGYAAGENGSIWVHGASLGEVITLKPFLSELAGAYGKNNIVCTSATLDGLYKLQGFELCSLAALLPVELPSIITPFIEKIKPKILLISETEIWPLLLDTLQKKGIPYGIINGRISEKSVRLMRLAYPLFKSAIGGLSFVFSQTKQYRRRFKILGVPTEKQLVLGSFKYDTGLNEPPKEPITLGGKKIIVFGSTHTGEEEIILEALNGIWQRLNALIVLAPRHIRRISAIERLFKDRNIEYALLSEAGKRPGARVILVDSMGKLQGLYASASLAFIGGSLVEHGGHNVMEPAVFACPTITGKHMFNFKNEMSALKKAGAVIQVNNGGELKNALLSWAKQPAEFIEAGKRAKEVLADMSGASARTLECLQERGVFLPWQNTTK